MILYSLVIIALLAPPDDAPAPAPKGGDRAKLQGTWAGKLGTQGIDVVMEVVGDKVVMTVSNPAASEQKLTIEGDYKLDESKTPRWWDFLRGKSNDGKDVPDSKSIYELNGDTLKVCNGLGRERPTEFKDAVPGSPQLIVFTRRKGTGDAPKAAPK